MRLYVDFDIEEFEAWSGGVDTKNAIIEAGKSEEFNALVDDIFMDGCTDTEMNDYLWFDSENIYEMLGLNEDGDEEEKEDEEENIDFSKYGNFECFCDSFGSTCEGCPFNAHLSSNFDCEEHLKKLKEESSICQFERGIYYEQSN